MGTSPEEKDIKAYYSIFSIYSLLDVKIENFN